jgi:hypothetical protein
VTPSCASTDFLRREREWRRRGAERHRRKSELAVASESIEPACEEKIPLATKTEQAFKAGAGIEPANSGFADRDLTTWLPRRLGRGIIECGA